jgi:predicted dehydrogenase
VGLIGCGGISKRHVSWFLERPECDISAVCDTSEDAMARCVDQIREMRPHTQVKRVASYHDLLARPELDGVAILLPHFLHHPVAKDALEAGKHVLVEKPMVVRVDHAQDLVDTARRTGKLLGIAYQRSYLPEYLFVRKMVQEGELGTVRFITVHLEQAWFAGRLAKVRDGDWRSDPGQAGGGQLVDTGSHTIAALLYVTQLAPIEVFAYVDNCGLDVDVNSAMVVRFANGAQASISIGGFGHKVTESLRVVGDKASARIFFRTVREQSLEIDGQVVDAASMVRRSTPNANFCDAMLGKANLGADGELGLRVARLSEAAYESARRGAPVRLA